MLQPPIQEGLQRPIQASEGIVSNNSQCECGCVGEKAGHANGMASKGWERSRSACDSRGIFGVERLLLFVLGVQAQKMVHNLDSIEVHLSFFGFGISRLGVGSLIASRDTRQD